MRKYPHKPEEDVSLLNQKETEEDYRSSMLNEAHADAMRAPNFFEGNSRDARKLAALAYAFEKPTAEVRSWLGEASRLAAKALEYKAVMNDGMYTEWLALALLTGDTRFQHDLESLRREDFINPNIRPDEIFYLGAEAYRDLAAGRDAAARESVESAFTRMNTSRVERIAKEVVMPMLLMEQAILDGDAAKLAEAVNARHERWRKGYSRGDERNYPYALLDVVGLGLLKIAASRGLAVPATSVYLPTELL